MFPRRPVLVCGLFVTLTMNAAPPDTLRWLRYQQPTFPVQLMETLAQDGSATLVFTFDEAGRITDRIVLAATHPAFVVAVYEAVREWQVDTHDLARSAHRETIRFDFQRRHPVLAMSQRDAVKSAFGLYGDQAGSALITFREAELRPGLATLATVMPDYPSALAKEHARGVATINFVVDAEGHVRVPAVTDASEPEFGKSALAAIRQWRFSPPLQNGTPVQVMVDRTFRFGGDSEKK